MTDNTDAQAPDTDDTLIEYTTEEKAAYYDTFVQGYFKQIQDRAIDCIDFGEENELWQNLQDNRGCPENVVAWLHTLALLQDATASGQARWEMVSSCEHTQHAVALASNISDICSQISQLTEDLVTYHCHYRAVLAGRRAFDITYTNLNGDFVENTELDSIDTSAMRKYDSERRRREEDLRRSKALRLCETTKADAETLDSLLATPVFTYQGQAVHQSAGPKLPPSPVSE